MTLREALLLTVALAGCAHPQQRQTEHGASAVSLPSQTSGTGWRLPASAAVGERNRCIDRELRARDLNDFGDPAGTVYPEGHPLDVTDTTNRYDYVLRRLPGIRTTCAQTGLEPDR